LFVVFCLNLKLFSGRLIVSNKDKTSRRIYH